MKKIDKLCVDWGKKEDDLMVHFPLGCDTRRDARWLCGIFNAEFLGELKLRGYDEKTIKFSVEPISGNDKFASQREGENNECRT